MIFLLCCRASLTCSYFRILKLRPKGRDRCVVLLAIVRSTDEPSVCPDVIVTHGLEVISVAPELTKERLHAVALLQRGVLDVELAVELIAAIFVLPSVELTDHRLHIVYRELAVILRFVAINPVYLPSAAAIEAILYCLTIALPAEQVIVDRPRPERGMSHWTMDDQIDKREILGMAEGHAVVGNHTVATQ